MGTEETMHLALDFYRRDTVAVARDLLGKELVCRTPQGESAGIIVETEAYLGAGDPASHAFGGRRTRRTETLFGPAGRAYVYLIYGLYHCLNLTSGESEEKAECVLIRALEPSGGIDLMRERRGVTRGRDLARGPGRLCLALGIGMELNGSPLEGGLFVREGRNVAEEEISASPRVGIDYAREAREWPLRFLLRGSRFVSRP